MNNISINNYPQKTTYHSGEDFDFSDGTVELLLEDGTYKVVDFGDEDIYIYYRPINGVVNKYEVLVCYGTYSDIFTIDILDSTLGDLDQDGDLSVIDVRLLLQVVLNNNWREEDLIVMDIDGDDEITIIDVRLLLQRLMNND